MNRIRKALGNLVMPSDAPQCPYCGSRLLIVEREAYGSTTESIDTVETCSTCGESWSEGSADWNEVHPALVALGTINECPCCQGDYDECDCALIMQPDGTAICDTHDKVCQIPQESEATE